jgi:hypothetical protein
MTKVETLELAKLAKYQAAGMTATVALGLSALIRMTLRRKTHDTLLALAEAWGVTTHPDFVI